MSVPKLTFFSQAKEVLNHLSPVKRTDSSDEVEILGDNKFGNFFSENTIDENFGSSVKQASQKSGNGEGELDDASSDQGQQDFDPQFLAQLENFGLDENGEEVDTKLTVKKLQNIAEDSAGKFVGFPPEVVDMESLQDYLKKLDGLDEDRRLVQLIMMSGFLQQQDQMSKMVGANQLLQFQQLMQTLMMMMIHQSDQKMEDILDHILKSDNLNKLQDIMQQLSQNNPQFDEMLQRMLQLVTQNMNPDDLQKMQQIFDQLAQKLSLQPIDLLNLQNLELYGEHNIFMDPSLLTNNTEQSNTVEGVDWHFLLMLQQGLMQTSELMQTDELMQRSFQQTAEALNHLRQIDMANMVQQDQVSLNLNNFDQLQQVLKDLIQNNNDPQKVNEILQDMMKNTSVVEDMMTSIDMMRQALPEAFDSSLTVEGLMVKSVDQALENTIQTLDQTHELVLKFETMGRPTLESVDPTVVVLNAVNNLRNQTIDVAASDKSAAQKMDMIEKIGRRLDKLAGKEDLKVEVAKLLEIAADKIVLVDIQPKEANPELYTKDILKVATPTVEELKQQVLANYQPEDAQVLTQSFNPIQQEMRSLTSVENVTVHINAQADLIAASTNEGFKLDQLTLTGGANIIEMATALEHVSQFAQGSTQKMPTETAKESFNQAKNNNTHQEGAKVIQLDAFIEARPTVDPVVSSALSPTLQTSTIELGETKISITTPTLQAQTEQSSKPIMSASEKLAATLAKTSQTNEVSTVKTVEQVTQNTQRSTDTTKMASVTAADIAAATVEAGAKEVIEIAMEESTEQQKFENEQKVENTNTGTTNYIITPDVQTQINEIAQEQQNAPQKEDVTSKNVAEETHEELNEILKQVGVEAPSEDAEYKEPQKEVVLQDKMCEGCSGCGTASAKCGQAAASEEQMAGLDDGELDDLLGGDYQEVETEIDLQDKMCEGCAGCGTASAKCGQAAASEEQMAGLDDGDLSGLLDEDYQETQPETEMEDKMCNGCAGCGTASAKCGQAAASETQMAGLNDQDLDALLNYNAVETQAESLVASPAYEDVHSQSVINHENEGVQVEGIGELAVEGAAMEHSSSRVNVHQKQY